MAGTAKEDVNEKDKVYEVSRVQISALQAWLKILFSFQVIMEIFQVIFLKYHCGFR